MGCDPGQHQADATAQPLWDACAYAPVDGAQISCICKCKIVVPCLLPDVFQNPHLPAFAQSNLHLDILMGRDETIGPADVFFGKETDHIPQSPLLRLLSGMEHGPSFDVHAKLEKQSRS